MGVKNQAQEVATDRDHIISHSPCRILGHKKNVP